MSLCDQVHSSLERVIRELLARHARPHGALRDVGCWTGELTRGDGLAARAERLDGVEGSSEEAPVAQRHFDCRVVDIEGEPIPLPDGSIDTAVCNQVREHCTNIVNPLSDMWRVLRPGGLLLVSVPNLASLHNRLLLAAGRQPRSFRIFGPHVRGGAYRAFLGYPAYGRRSRIVDAVGVGRYPLPGRIGDRLGRHVPSLARTPVIALRSRAAAGPDWDDWVREHWTVALGGTPHGAEATAA